MPACSLTQCVQTFRPPKAQENVEKRKKKRQPYMLFFWAFQGGFTFFIILGKMLTFLLHKNQENPKSHLLRFLRYAQSAMPNSRRKERQKAPLLREIAKSEHIGLTSLKFGER